MNPTTIDRLEDSFDLNIGPEIARQKRRVEAIMAIEAKWIADWVRRSHPLHLLTLIELLDPNLLVVGLPTVALGSGDLIRFEPGQFEANQRLSRMTLASTLKIVLDQMDRRHRAESAQSAPATPQSSG